MKEKRPKQTEYHQLISKNHQAREFHCTFLNKRLSKQFVKDHQFPTQNTKTNKTTESRGNTRERKRTTQTNKQKKKPVEKRVRNETHSNANRKKKRYENVPIKRWPSILLRNSNSEEMKFIEYFCFGNFLIMRPQNCTELLMGTLNQVDVIFGLDFTASFDLKRVVFFSLSK